MRDLGEWLKQVPPLRAALGIVFILCAAAFSLGAATDRFMQTMVEIPARLLLLEEGVVIQEQSTEEFRADLFGIRQDLGQFFRQDSVYKWKTNCILERVVRGQELGRYDCDPETNSNGEGAS